MLATTGVRKLCMTKFNVMHGRHIVNNTQGNIQIFETIIENRLINVRLLIEQSENY